MMDKLFLAEIKAKALATGRWEEDAAYPMWVFPDGTGIASMGDIHGFLAVDLELASRNEVNEDYEATIVTLLSFGLVRVRYNTIQVYDRSGFAIAEKYAMKANRNFFTLDVVSANESYSKLDYEARDFSIEKATIERKRAGDVGRYGVVTFI